MRIAKQLGFDSPVNMVAWEELDRYFGNVEREGVEYVLKMEGVVIKEDAREMIWE